MRALSSMSSSDSSTHPAVSQIAVQVPDTLRPAVRNCSRLVRIANPPGFSFTEWLRDLRNR
jgi:hypothetical protein